METDGYLIATFVTLLGQESSQCVTAFQCAEGNKMTVVIDLMERHCIGESNVIYDMLSFNRCYQEKHESFKTYVTTLRELRRWKRNSCAIELSVEFEIAGTADNCFRGRDTHSQSD